MAEKPGLLVVVFTGPSRAQDLVLSEGDLEPWRRVRGVTVADLAAATTGPALDVALNADLVYLRQGFGLDLPGPHQAPTAGLVWALSRAGSPALARGLLRGGTVSGEEAVNLGLVQGVVAPGQPLPLPQPFSLTALTAVRDLMRCRATGAAALNLELATFRLLFACGEPAEGARAFLQRREPCFATGAGPGSRD